MYFCTEKLGKTRYKTPEGFLVCQGAPIARIGTLDYAKADCPGIKGGPIIKVTRPEKELFNEKTIASFEGKPLVISHKEFVDPENFQRVSRGTVQNVRRGEGELKDYLLADLVICDAEAIRKVESGELVELSNGFDADLIQRGYGEAIQEGIVGNHVALVESARCGHKCRIGDSMKTSFKNLIRRAFKDGDEEKLNDALDDLKLPQADEGEHEQEEEKKTAPQVDEEAPDLEARLAKIEQMLSQLLEKGKTADEDDVAQVDGDAAEEEEKQSAADGDDEEEHLVGADEAEQVFKDAEEICEGVKRPTADGVKGGFTVGRINRLKRAALQGCDSGFAKGFGDVSRMGDEALDTVFRATVAHIRASKNPFPHKGKDGMTEADSIAAMQSRFDDFWKNK